MQEGRRLPRTKVGGRVAGRSTEGRQIDPHWVFLSDQAVLHEIAANRGRAVAETVLGEHRPEVWISDRYAGQQGLAEVHQVCLAHVLRDVQYAIDCGDTLFAPKIRELLRWAIRIGKRRPSLKDSMVW